MNDKKLIIINYLCYALLFTIPIGVVISILRYNHNKSNSIYLLPKDESKEHLLLDIEKLESEKQQLLNNVESIKLEIKDIENASKDYDVKLLELNDQINVIQKELYFANQTYKLQKHGIYSFDYSEDLLDKEYEEFKIINSKIENDVLNDNAFQITNKLYVNKTKEEGLELQKSSATFMVRSFIVSCEEIIDNLTKQNYDKQVEKIKKLYEKLNKDNLAYHIKINGQFANNIVEKLNTQKAFVNRLELEKEERKKQKAIIKEQQKLVKEEEQRLKAIQSDLKRNEEQLNNYKNMLESDPSNIQLKAEIEKLTLKNEQLSNESTSSQEKMKKLGAGFVYIISNIGAFGENIYKIGFTRREEPEMRIKELSGASVPFKFDVHAFIYDDKASELESKIHNKLSDFRVNKDNLRKEFFNVELETIKSVVSEYFNKPVDFLHTNLSDEYYKSIKKGSEESYENI